MHSFFANQSSGPQLDHEDLEQIDEFDLDHEDLEQKGVKFSGKVTPLFDSMLVPHQAPEGEGLEQPTEPQPTSSPTYPSIGDQPPVTDSSSSHDTTQDFRDSLEDTNESKWT
ncbi:hypothetical protein Tco_1205428 [Tanacetum coccineum]